MKDGEWMDGWQDAADGKQECEAKRIHAREANARANGRRARDTRMRQWQRAKLESNCSAKTRLPSHHWPTSLCLSPLSLSLLSHPLEWRSDHSKQ